uniref:CYtochrome P450 family n=1 Tax=Caenorhabditis tropicalis TaxID=1561998 RepID=A0A1I7TXV1_9PELO
MFFALIISALLTWLVVRQYRKVSRLPPGPFSLPLIGNLPQIVYYLWTTGSVSSTFDLFRKRYGNIFTLWVGPIPHVSIADYETSHEVFVKNASKYADKFHAPLFAEIKNENGVLATNGDHWQEMRRFALQTFRNMGVGKDQMEVKIMEELDARCADIDKQAINGVTTTHASDFFDLTVGSIINSILVGKRFEEHNKQEFLKIKRALDSAFELFSPFDLTVPIWVLKYFFNRRYTNMINLNEETTSFVAKEACERYAELKKGNYRVDKEKINDFTDAFLLKIQEGGENRDFNIETLKTMIIDLWITGQETTTTTLISGFNQLLLHPQVTDKARKEILEVTDNGSRPLCLADKLSTPYLNAMIGEIQRHASILNMNFWRINHEPTYMGGYPVDSGAFVTAQLSALHINETVFENPKKFDPERFIRDEKLLQKVIPFGVGKRSCLGEALARSELYLIFGNLLFRYNFKPHGKLSTEEVLPYSFAKRPFKLEMQFIKI